MEHIVLPLQRRARQEHRSSDLLQHRGIGDEFAWEYPTYVEDSKVRAGRLFSMADYPNPSDIRSLFEFDSKILPCPDLKFVPTSKHD